MSVGTYVVMLCAMCFLGVISLGMTGRALLSWFTMGEPTKLGAFLYVLTEPIIMPIRALCNRFGWFRGLPIDMPFFIASLVLMLVMMLLQTSLYL